MEKNNELRFEDTVLPFNKIETRFFQGAGCYAACVNYVIENLDKCASVKAPKTAELVGSTLCARKDVYGEITIMHFSGKDPIPTPIARTVYGKWITLLNMSEKGHTSDDYRFWNVIKNLA